MNPECPNCGSDELVYQPDDMLWYCRACDSVFLRDEVEWDELPGAEPGDLLSPFIERDSAFPE